MSSPLGHALAGAALGVAFARPGSSARLLAVAGLAGALVALAPDLDFVAVLTGAAPRESIHRTATHSLAGLAAAALALATPIALLLAVGRRRAAALGGLAWGSHVALDLLTPDSRAPAGLALWWPFSERFVAPWPLLPEVDLTRALDTGVRPLVPGLLLEGAAFGAVLALAVRWRRRPGPAEPSAGPLPGRLPNRRRLR